MACNGEAQGRTLARHTSSHQHTDQHGNKARLTRMLVTQTQTGTQDLGPTATAQGVLLDSRGPWWLTASH